MTEQAYHVTPAQFAAVVKSALGSLLRHKLVKKSRAGKYSSPLAEKFYVFPRTYGLP